MNKEAMKAISNKEASVRGCKKSQTGRHTVSSDSQKQEAILF